MDDGTCLRLKLGRLFDNLMDLGIEFEEDWTCCTSCGHAEMEAAEYVFYHAQDMSDIRNGCQYVYLAWEMTKEREDIVRKFIEENDLGEWKESKRIRIGSLLGEQCPLKEWNKKCCCSANLEDAK